MMSISHRRARVKVRKFALETYSNSENKTTPVPTVIALMMLGVALYIRLLSGHALMTRHRPSMVVRLGMMLGSVFVTS